MTPQRALESTVKVLSIFYLSLLSAICSGLSFSALPAEAETMVEKSLEWLCSDSDLIVLGKVKSVSTRVLEGQRKEAILELAPQSILKRSEKLPLDAGGSLRIRTSSTDPPEQMKAVKLGKGRHKILAFLKIVDGKVTPDSDDSPFSLFDLEDASTRSFSADCRRVPGDSLVRKTESSLLLLSKLRAKSPERKLAKHYKPAPYDSDAGKELYSGSSTFLIVPSGLSPDSRPSLF